MAVEAVQESPKPNSSHQAPDGQRQAGLEPHPELQECPKPNSAHPATDGQRSEGQEPQGESEERLKPNPAHPATDRQRNGGQEPQGESQEGPKPNLAHPATDGQRSGDQELQGESQASSTPNAAHQTTDGQPRRGPEPQEDPMDRFLRETQDLRVPQASSTPNAAHQATDGRRRGGPEAEEDPMDRFLRETQDLRGTQASSTPNPAHQATDGQRQGGQEPQEDPMDRFLRETQDLREKQAISTPNAAHQATDGQRRGGPAAEEDPMDRFLRETQDLRVTQASWKPNSAHTASDRLRHRGQEPQEDPMDRFLREPQAISKPNSAHQAAGWQQCRGQEPKEDPMERFFLASQVSSRLSSVQQAGDGQRRGGRDMQEEPGRESRKRARSPESSSGGSSSECSDSEVDAPNDQRQAASQGSVAAFSPGASPDALGQTQNGFFNFAGPVPQPGQQMGGFGAAGQSSKLQRSASGRQSFESMVFRCAACRVDSSGETSFLQHVQGRKHLSKTKGRVFAGLLHNDAGVIPALSPRAAAMLGQTPSTAQAQPIAADGSTAPAQRRQGSGNVSLPSGVRRLQLTPQGEEALGAALQAAGGHAKAERHDSGSLEDSSSARARGLRRRAPPRVPPAPLVEGGPLRKQRESLPAFSMRSDLLRAIRQNSVVVVEGETGSGKTTQIPQYILEEATVAGMPCSVVCTQPRRISAIGVADRVAEERGERTGGLVGYSVRLDNCATDATQLLFVTTGILLRRMEEDPELEGTTHVIVDEVHERAEESDFLLLALRSLLRRRPELRVVLMSATLDTSLFSRYFHGAPVIQVSGRTYPVQTLYLEDALALTGHVVRPGADWAIGGGLKGKGKGGDDWKDKKPEHPPEEFTPETLRQRYGQHGPQVWTALKTLDPDAVDFDLVAALVQMAITGRLAAQGESNTTAVLVFLSGIKEISTLHEELLRLPELRQEPQRSWVLPLHGSLPSEEQRRVFESPPPGVRKIVLATNVAETSITINDVGVVVDTARMKENSYDGARRVSSLEDVVVSRSNAKQRRGRAGRVASGVAVHLITKYRHDCLLPDRRLPEVKRVPLEQLVLRIHSIKISVLEEQPGSSGRSAGTVCAQLLEPPEPDAVRKAIEELVDMDALTVDAARHTEELTALGSRLATLPVDARIGKLILLGSVFGDKILDHALTIAAALTLGSPFLRPWEKREEADKVRCRFAEKLASDQVGPSDHLGTLVAYCEADSLRRGDRANYCRENMLGTRSLQSMGALKRQLLEHLSAAGFVRQGLRAKDAEACGRRDGSDGVRAALQGQMWGSSTSANTPRPEEVPLLAALLCAALFPQVARISLPKVSKKKRKSGKGQDPQHMKIYVQVAGEEERARIHPSSVAARASKAMTGFLVYHELVKTTQLYIRDVTQLPPLALLLFGGALKQEGHPFHSQGPEVILSVGGSAVRFSVPVRLVDALYKVRGQLDRLLRKRTEQGLNAQPNGYQQLWGDNQDNVLLSAVTKLLNCGTEESDDDSDEDDDVYQSSKRKKKKKSKGDRKAQLARRKRR